MDKGKPSRFFRAQVNNNSYKVFLDDVAVIYKVAQRKTPPLQSYYSSSKCNVDETDESMQP